RPVFGDTFALSSLALLLKGDVRDQQNEQVVATREASIVPKRGIDQYCHAGVLPSQTYDASVITKPLYIGIFSFGEVGRLASWQVVPVFGNALSRSIAS